MKCLIVEDDFTARRLLQQYLRAYGDCTIAINGREAVACIEQALALGQPFDLVCLDIMMPEMSGMGVLNAIRRMERQFGIHSQNAVKVIITTALSDYGQVAEAFKMGCQAYIVKPVSKKKLLRQIEKLGLIQFQTSK